jgi:hypothetical protein
VFGPIFIGPLVPALETPSRFKLENIVPGEYPYRPTDRTPYPAIP